MANSKLVRASLPSLPKLPSLPAFRVQRPCACGCGRLTGHTFAPGHDARLKGGCLRVLGGSVTIEQVAQVMGKPFAEAVTRAIADRALMARWGITVVEEVEKAG